jgi:hypothetical protein
MFAVGNEPATGRATRVRWAPKQRHPPGPPMPHWIKVKNPEAPAATRVIE